MDHELEQRQNLEIDSLELIVRYALICEESGGCPDIVTAIYYFRRYPNVHDFINEHVKECSGDKNYETKVQWLKIIWTYLSTMGDMELSDLIIKEISQADILE